MYKSGKPRKYWAGEVEKLEIYLLKLEIYLLKLEIYLLKTRNLLILPPKN